MGCRKWALQRILGVRKGSAMVEAAILFPLVILTLAALITVLVQLYEEAGERSLLHRILLRESGAATEIFLPGGPLPETLGAATTLGLAGIHPTREGAVDIPRHGFGLLKTTTPMHVESRTYLLDEQKNLMLKALGKEAVDFEKEYR